MVPLPFADDLREDSNILDYAGFKQNENKQSGGIIETLTKEEKNTAKLLVKNLNIDFDSRDFENPTIQKFFSGLQALALNEQEPEQIHDTLEPDYDGLKRFDQVLGRFKGVFYNGAKEDPACAEKPKRAAGGGKYGRPNPNK